MYTPSLLEQKTTESMYGKVIELAEKIIKDNYISSAPVHIDEIVKNYGLIVVEADLDHQNISGFIDVRNKRIVLNKYETEARKAFTIAHELGHYLMHKNELEQNPDRYAIFYRAPMGAPQDSIEEEATCFASRLLVPEKILQQYKDYDNNTLAKIFGVPIDVIGLRTKGGVYGTYS